MARLTFAFLLVAAAARFSHPGEAQRFSEQDLKQAELLADEGDLHGAVSLWFRILRQADSKDLRDEAREHLEHAGLTGQEILQLDPAAMKAEERDKLLSRLAAAAAQQKRQELDLGYAVSLLRAAVSSRPQTDGSFKVEVQPKDLARALDLMLQVALSEQGGEPSRDAQSQLERLGVVGTQVEAVRKAAAEGKLPSAVQSEIVCAVCLHQLERYRHWLEEREEQEDQGLRKQLARRLGLAVYKYLAAQHAQTAAFKRPSEDLDFWRDLAAPNVDKTF